MNWPATLQALAVLGGIFALLALALCRAAGLADERSRRMFNRMSSGEPAGADPDPRKESP